MTKKADRDRRRLERASATYLKEQVDATLSRDGLRSLQARVVEGLSDLFFSTSPMVRACDKAKLAATLGRICGWDQQALHLLYDPPPLHIVIDDDPNPEVRNEEETPEE